jgi:hypothetical protein
MKSKVILDATGREVMTSDLFSPGNKNRGDTRFAGDIDVSLTADRIASDFLFLLGLLSIV